MTFKILMTVNFHSVSTQPRKCCDAELRIAADTGRINPKGMLHGGLVMSAQLLKLHVVLMESVNSMLGNIARTCPNISLELLSARIGVKKRLGFLRERDCPTHITNSSSDAYRPGTDRVQVSKALKPIHRTVISALSMKQAKPYALQAMEQTLGLWKDGANLVQNMFRFSSPNPLEHMPDSNPCCLNEDDRPFCVLPAEQRREAVKSQSFHQQWFECQRDNFAGKPCVVCFFNAETSQSDFWDHDLRQAVRIYFVSETFSTQES